MDSTVANYGTIFVTQLVAEEAEVELCGRAAVLLLRHHCGPLSTLLAGASTAADVRSLGDGLLRLLDRRRRLWGADLAGLRFASRELQSRRAEKEAAAALYGGAPVGGDARGKKGKAAKKRARRVISMEDAVDNSDDL